MVAQAPAGAWRPIAPDALLVMTVEGGKRVVIQLAPAFAPAHVANIRALARAGWLDGESAYRVPDHYFTQWGAAEEKTALPPRTPPNLCPSLVPPPAPPQGAPTHHPP